MRTLRAGEYRYQQFDDLVHVQHGNVFAKLSKARGDFGTVAIGPMRDDVQPREIVVPDRLGGIGQLCLSGVCGNLERFDDPPSGDDLNVASCVGTSIRRVEVLCLDAVRSNCVVADERGQQRRYSELLERPA